MTTQQKLDCLLKQLRDETPHQGQEIILKAPTIALLIERCRFANCSEIGFYIRSLAERSLVQSHCSGDDTILGARITIDGYCYLDDLR